MSRDDREIEKDFQIGSLSLFHPYTNNQKSRGVSVKKGPLLSNFIHFHYDYMSFQEACPRKKYPHFQLTRQQWLLP